MSEDLFEFEGFVLDRAGCELRRRGEIVPLQRIPLDLLCLLVERRGRLVTREEILERVWGKGVFVDTEASINTAIRKIRRALRDDPDAPRFVVTVPARGYRFIAEVGPLETNEPGQFRGRTRGAMVGRERELTSLVRGLEDAASGRGNLFLISGEPGVGKTRLAEEVAASARAKRMTLLVGHCTEQEEAVPYLPFVEILENIVDRLAEPDRLRRALGEQGQELARVLPKLRSILPELPPPLELAPAQARRHLFNCFCDFVARLAREQPVLMILEDLHWADDSTLSLLDHLTQRLSDLPLLIVGTYRDAQLNITRGLARALEDLIRGRQATWVGLKTLSRDEVAVMLEALSSKSPPVPLVGEFYTETDGNPFFVEELFRHLEEESRLYDSAGHLRSDLRLAELEAPPRLRLVIARRLERLSVPTQKMLATAATIGRIFSFEILQASSGTEAGSLLDCVEEAERAGLIFPVAEGPRVRLEFSHELTRQAVIGGLSSARREKLHLEVAEAIERICRAAPESGSAESLDVEALFADKIDEHLGDLAHHYVRSANRQKAVEYLRLAGEQSLQRYANAEAISRFTNALELLKTLPDRPQRAHDELVLQTSLGPALVATMGNGAPEVGAVYARAVELGRELGGDAQLFPVLFGLRSFHLVRGELRRASELAEQLLSVAESALDSGFLVEAHLAQGNSLFFAGEFIPALEHLERAVALYDPQKHGSHALLYGLDPGMFCRSRIAWALALLGYPDRASQKIGEALASAHQATHPLTLAICSNHAGMIHIQRGEAKAAQQQAEAAVVLCAEYGFANILAQSKMHLGPALAMQGRGQEGVALIEQGLDTSRATGAILLRTLFLGILADVCRTARRCEKGLTALTEAIATMEKTGERFLEAELYRLSGELLLMQDAPDAAQADRSFREAIEVARRQRAKSFELRATASLARLLKQQGKKEEARQMLSEIYGWFTEGFDTADLKDAKALLEELST
jgi:DNA-binding winged helix-turn-helix (wHTH) protein/predicted ATPase